METQILFRGVAPMRWLMYFNCLKCTVTHLLFCIDVDQCTSYPCVIFEDEFDKLDMQKWQHELTASGEGVRLCLQSRHWLHYNRKQ